MHAQHRRIASLMTLHIVFHTCVNTASAMISPSLFFIYSVYGGGGAIGLDGLTCLLGGALCLLLIPFSAVNRWAGRAIYEAVSTQAWNAVTRAGEASIHLQTSLLAIALLFGSVLQVCVQCSTILPELF